MLGSAYVDSADESDLLRVRARRGLSGAPRVGAGIAVGLVRRAQVRFSGAGLGVVGVAVGVLWRASNALWIGHQFSCCDPLDCGLWAGAAACQAQGCCGRLKGLRAQGVPPLVGPVLCGWACTRGRVSSHYA